MKNLRKLFALLVGEPGEFSLESRIFHSTCLVGIVGIVYNIPFNYFIGLYVSSLISFFLFVVFLFLYYLSRIKNKLIVSYTLGGVLISLMLAINYFFNSGVEGASLILFLLVYFLGSIVSSYRHYYYWFFFNLVIVLGVLVAEYLYPQSIVAVYENRTSHLIDVASTYLISIILVTLATYFFRKAYKAERNLVEEKTVVLERLNAEKNKLFSIIAHDLRSPLASVQQYLEILQEAELEEKEKKTIEVELLEVVRHTQEMLFNLLSWSTTQMLGVHAELTPVTIHTILKPIVEIYKPLASKKGIEISYSVGPSFRVMADTNMLQLIVRNLLGNAIKFTYSGGLIEIETREFENNCLIIIKDNGIGITAGDKATIFSLKTKTTFGTGYEKGVGLGLLLCKEYAEAQQGKLWFESEEGVGATFFLSLPIAP